MSSPAAASGSVRRFSFYRRISAATGGTGMCRSPASSNSSTRPPFSMTMWSTMPTCAGDLAVLKVLSNATTVIAEGEVLQLVCTSDLDITEERYIEVVKCKTAILLSAACQAGAILGKVSPEQEAAMAAFGMDLGIAFQLMDDTLDYIASEEQFGKSIG